MNRDTGRLIHLTHYMLSSGSLEDNSAQLRINSMVFNFSRISAVVCLYNVCYRLVPPVHADTEITCTDME